MGEFWVIRDGERIGPFAEAELLRSYENGALQGSDVLWAEGMVNGATVDEAFKQLREAILTSSQSLALAEIAPRSEGARTSTDPLLPEVASPAARAPTAGAWKRGWLAALAGLLLVALALAAYQLFF